MNGGMDGELRQLLDQWYEVVSLDHHKEKDCWFQICENFCAYRVGVEGEVKQEWYFQHEGYLEEDQRWEGWRTFPTRAEAVDNLKDFLRYAIAKWESLEHE